MDQAKHSLIMTLCDCDKDNQNAVEKGIFINGIISEWVEDNLKSILGLTKCEFERGNRRI